MEYPAGKICLFLRNHLLKWGGNVCCFCSIFLLSIRPPLFQVLHFLPSGKKKTMTMDSVAGKNGVLKLVLPGGVVETYKNPITAAEVMRKYPRHCVARPDVFRYPWIVVRPESVLNPDQKFFIVPYHTIRRLLQRNGYRNHSSPGQQEAHISVIKETPDCRRLKKITSSPEYHSWVKVAADQKHHRDSGVDHHPFLYEFTMFHRQVNKQSPNESLCNKKNPKNENFNSRHLRSKYPHDQFAKKKIPLIKLLAQLKMQQNDNGGGSAAHDGRSPARKQYPVKCWPTKIKPLTPDDSLVEPTKFQSSREYASDHDGAVKSRRCRLLSRKDDGLKIKDSQHYASDYDGATKSRRRLSRNDDGLKIKDSQHYSSDHDGAAKIRRRLSRNGDGLKIKYLQRIAPENEMKSILKKHKNNISKSHLRVNFALPEGDEQELRIEDREF